MSDTGTQSSSQRATPATVTIQTRRSSVARGPESEDTVPEFKVGPQTSRTLPGHQRGIPGHLSVTSPSLMEDTRCIPRLPPIALSRNDRAWPQLHAATA
jgi:hypothetical protein